MRTERGLKGVKLEVAGSAHGHDMSFFCFFKELS